LYHFSEGNISNYPQRQGNNPGLSGAVFSVKVGNRVGKSFEGKK
jgi:hypothetical protein